MSKVIPQSELTKKAIAWICEQQELSAGAKSLRQLIDEACTRFNLGPLDEEFLARFFANKKEQG